MKLSVIILNWNDAANTLSCIKSVQQWQQLCPEILVVDNGSDADDLAELIRGVSSHKPDQVQLICSEANRGFAGGNNLALAVCRTEPDGFALLLNTDAAIAEEQVQELIGLLAQHPEAAIIGPVLIEEGGKGTIISAGGQNIGQQANAHINLPALTTETDSIRVVDYVPGTIALLRTRTLEQIGLLDERYFFAGEVADWCRRAQQQGYTALIANQVYGYHYYDKPSDIRASLYCYYSLRNRFLFVRKFESFWRPGYWLYYSWRMALANWKHGNRATARAAWLAGWHGLLGRFGNQNHLFLSSE